MASLPFHGFGFITYFSLFPSSAESGKAGATVFDFRLNFLAQIWLKCVARKLKMHFNVLLQPKSLGLFRSDYFFCTQKGSNLQVEFNTVASSFGGLSTELSNAHKSVLTPVIIFRALLFSFAFCFSINFYFIL